MRIACGIITYNPSYSDVQNLISYASCFEGVFVYDNTENTTEKYFLEITQYKNIEIVHKGENNGLAIACDSLCRVAKEYGFDYIITFDQDSRMDKENVDLFLTEIEEDFKNDNLSKQVAIYCPQIVTEQNHKKNLPDKLWVKWCITSGSAMNLELYGNQLQFDANYFIDRVDKDICKQAISKGYGICQVNSVVLNHVIGENRIVRGKSYSTHSPLRHYYIARNRLYYRRKYNENFGIMLLQFLRHIWRVISFEDNKKEKVIMILQGINDYKLNKMGRKTDDKIK